jgi:hypothetical protein
VPVIYCLALKLILGWITRMNTLITWNACRATASVPRSSCPIDLFGVHARQEFPSRSQPMRKQVCCFPHEPIVRRRLS